MTLKLSNLLLAATVGFQGVALHGWLSGSVSRSRAASGSATAD